MLPRHHPDGIRIAFDGHRLVVNVRLILAGALALRLALPSFLQKRLDLGIVPDRANTDGKMMTLVGPPL